MNLLFKLYLERKGLYLLGPGRMELLRTVDRLGSLKKAAQELGMSYRWAWGRLKKTEQTLGVDLLAHDSGAARKKGKKLTKEAHELLAWIESIEKRMEVLLEESMTERPAFLNSLPSLPEGKTSKKLPLD